MLAVSVSAGLFAVGSPTRTVRAQSGGTGGSCGSAPIFIGYWHNFQNQAPFIKLGDVSSQFDVINIAFATPVSGSTSKIGFTLNSRETESDFIADVSALQTQGQKVVLSIGGANQVVKLNNAADVQDFVSSVSGIVNKFGFDGIDIDFESGSVVLNSGDSDFRNPTTTTIVNLIQALHQIKSAFGPDLIISLAPAVTNVQGGFKTYAGSSGAYLPVIFGIKDILSYVYAQDYNSGTKYGLDGKIYTEGTADFHVAMTEMLLQGFPVAGNSSNLFPALPPSQVAFGVPAYQTASGFTSNDDLENALSYLIKGIPFGGQYQLRNPNGYPGLRGLMTFSINWDSAYSFVLSNTIGPFLHGLGVAGPVITTVAADRKNLVVTGCGFDSGSVIMVNGQDEQTVDGSQDPATTLVGIKTIKRAHIRPGDQVTIQVQTGEGDLSNEFLYTAPES